MKIYKNTYYEGVEGNAGFSFHSNIKEAQKQMKEHLDKCGEVYDDNLNCTEQIEVTPTLKGIINALNIHASHNDNG